MYTTKRLWRNFLKPGAIYEYFEADVSTLFATQVWLLYIFLGLMIAGAATPLLAYKVTPLVSSLLISIGGYAILVQTTYFLATCLIGGIAFTLSYESILPALTFLPNRILAICLEIILASLKLTFILLFTAPADGIDYLFTNAFPKYNSLMGQLWGRGPESREKNATAPFRFMLFNYVSAHFDAIWITICLILLLGTLGCGMIASAPPVIFATMQSISLHCLLYFFIAGFIGVAEESFPDRGFNIPLLLPNWIIGIFAELNLLIIKLIATPFVAIIDGLGAPAMEIQSNCLRFDEFDALESWSMDSSSNIPEASEHGIASTATLPPSPNSSGLAKMHLLASPPRSDKPQTEQSAMATIPKPSSRALRLSVA